MTGPARHIAVDPIAGYADVLVEEIDRVAAAWTGAPGVEDLGGF